MLGGISRACGMQRVCFTVSGQHPRSGIPHRKTPRPSLDEEVPSNWESSGRQQIPRTGERWGGQFQSLGTGPGTEDPRNRSENRVKVAGDDKDARVVVVGWSSLKSTPHASWRHESHRTSGFLWAPSSGTGCRSSN